MKSPTGTEEFAGDRAGEALRDGSVKFLERCLMQALQTKKGSTSLPLNPSDGGPATSSAS